jgi:SAM-dependent methyltransferase
MPSAERPTPPAAAPASDAETLARHRAVWEARPELREVYRAWFRRLLDEIAGRAPVIEIGAGPGFFKEFAPHVVATDALRGPLVDVCCDAGALPFGDATLGAVVMIDVLHHLPRPVGFLREATRALRPGGRLAMLEPWITPASYVLYRWLHHECCDLSADLERPFGADAKLLLDGNPAIPFLAFGRGRADGGELRLRTRELATSVDYLATLGFRRARPVPRAVMALARAVDRLARPFGGALATRAFIVLEKPGRG